jgi:glutamine synthetase
MRHGLKAMSKQHFLFLGHQDFSGMLRGRSVPKERRKMALAQGLPWVPGNFSIGPTNIIPPDNPFGQQGEIRLLPDEGTMLALPAYDGKPAFDIALCDARLHDGAPWPYCPRTALKSAVDRLKAEAGLTMKVGFEHEFSVRGLNQVAHPAYSVASGRAVSHLAAHVLQTLAKSGIALEQFQAEYGTDQFEISSVPADPLTAADRVVLTQEAIRDGARQFGLHASFIPKPAPTAGQRRAYPLQPVPQRPARHRRKGLADGCVRILRPGHIGPRRDGPAVHLPVRQFLFAAAPQ